MTIVPICAALDVMLQRGTAQQSSEGGQGKGQIGSALLVEQLAVSPATGSQAMP